MIMVIMELIGKNDVSDDLLQKVLRNLEKDQLTEGNYNSKSLSLSSSSPLSPLSLSLSPLSSLSISLSISISLPLSSLSLSSLFLINKIIN